MLVEWEKVCLSKVPAFSDKIKRNHHFYDIVFSPEKGGFLASSLEGRREVVPRGTSFGQKVE